MAKLAPRNTEQARAFNRQAASSRTTQWFRMCLKLQRTARGIPAIYPTAASAQVATPKDERVSLTGLKQGMVFYTKGSNPAGHIGLVDGWKTGPKNADNLLVWSNDMAADGKGVALVPLSRILRNWNHDFQFGATWLNGWDFSEFNKPAKPVRGSLGVNYEHAIEDLTKSLHFHKRADHTELVKVLERDLELIKKNHAKYGKNNK